MSGLYTLSFTDSKGHEVSMNHYKNKVLLIVNTATKCGLTPQFEELEKLYDTYKSQSFDIIGFPCNQFANQEPESNESMAQVCKLNYGVSFLLSQKIDVNGKDTHPIFKYLKKHSNHWFRGQRIKWNFTKFLVSADGKIIKRYSPITKPSAIEKDIIAFLEK